ncbi:MAG TPA: argininosuccinate lyase [Thermodesulfobacteriota bacterium]|nr:argininosuccinate lyase [Thermodesulfobacteriota bacterium]
MPAPPKPWGGRFREATDPRVEAFTASVRFDRRLAPYDIAGSIAHARMLARVGLLTVEEAGAIVEGLERIRAEIDAGSFPWRPELEDVHMNIEARLVELVGPVGGKLHTGRSRNDQVALDLALYLRDAIDRLDEGAAALQRALGELAARHLDVVMPGYTHLQRAQPVLLAHHLLAYHEMLARDRQRLAAARTRINVLPLGAGALAGTPLPIDRHEVARLLGFDRVAENSLDAVADRDGALELLAALAILQVHLSRLAEELVLWSSAEFGFVELPDAFATGSSLMPQKKNPDVAELVRGKTGRVVGALVALLTTLKGLPLAYNRDLQEDKEPLFDAVDTVLACLGVLPPLLRGLKVRAEAMRAAAGRGFLTATDAADYLVLKGVPFRRAHEIVGGLVAEAVRRGVELHELPLETFRAAAPEFGPDIYDALAVERAVASRRSYGGTAPDRVRARLRELGYLP